ncbi:preprotein translocase subunit SecA [Neisseriaceae bacterium PsAf]|nr:preprotein translocase subunit SecA [Neisseriaceae bacterium PsAf]
MLANIGTKIFGSRNGRLLKQYSKIVKQINELEPSMQSKSDEELQALSLELRERASEGESLDKILPEAFALCREASVRVLGMRHFDVQLIGGIALHQGKVAEMKTGEGKTLVATLAVYLNALTGKGVHVVTVNDYLASRDANTLRPLYEFLGLTVGVNLSQMSPQDKKQAYAADVIYGTNNEFGFDYLRDNMVPSKENRVQRDLSYAVIDEVDSILIDEARTPLIISGQADDNVDLYKIMDQVPGMLTPQETEDGEGDYWVDGKTKQVILSESGHEKAEKILTEMGLLAEGTSLYSLSNVSLMHNLMAALRAHTLFFLNQHYVIQNGEIVIVDEFTGRLMSGRRWSEGLHQAIEAKEGLTINKENQTLASITYQNYFRLYDKLSGMTGTADTEAAELQSIYNLETVIIPTNRKMIRKDFEDQVYKTAEEKYEAVIQEIIDKHNQNQPVLVGTASIESSELVSQLLNKANISHNVLNAKEHEKEAYVVAQAGKPGMVTVSTNMAGRGTDIVLGGNISLDIKEIEEDESLSEAEKQQKIQALKNEWKESHQKVIDAGGLHIIGTERHDSRRIDNQLRGRSGRQGDPGSSRFFLSFEDSLLKYFALDRAAGLLNKLAPERGMPIEHKFLTRQIEGAQRKVEGRNFDIRKQILEYDDVANDQRKVIYVLRNNILDSENLDDETKEIIFEVINKLVNNYIPPESMQEEWNVPALEKELKSEFDLDIDINQWLQEDKYLDDEKIKQRLLEIIEQDYNQKRDMIGHEAMTNFERQIMLTVLDQNWREHLSIMDHLRQGIGLRGYGQKNPKQEYKREAFVLFEDLLDTIKLNIAKYLIAVKINPQPADEEIEHVDTLSEAQTDTSPAEMLSGKLSRPEVSDLSTDTENDPNMNLDAVLAAVERGEIYIGRNDPCPCGSGERFKDCHGKLS